MAHQELVIDIPELAHLVAEWHPTRNTFTDPHTGYEETRTPHNMKRGSAKPIWWRCAKTPSHEWMAALYSRTNDGNGCPFCSNQKLLVGFNDLGTVNPDLAAQWHPTLNGALTPHGVAPQSNGKAFWLCPAGGESGPEHAWEANIQSRHRGNGCPYCGNRKVLSGFNDLATKRPDIVLEWHPTKNTLVPSEISASSNKKAWWMCANGHEWEAIIANRTTKGSGCRQCNKSKPKAVRENVASKPELAASWHPDNSKRPEEVTLGSTMMVKWICPKESRHVWEATVANRDRGGQCTVCSGHTIIPGVNDLVTTHPDIAEQWHPDNERSVTTVGVGTEYLALWRCAEGHAWRSLPYSRVSQKLFNCPECSGRSKWQEEKRRVSHFPHMMDKWHPENELDPNEVSWRSRQMVKWKCVVDHRHVWNAAPDTQSVERPNCPVCSGRVVIPGINDFASHAAPQIVAEWHPDNDLPPTEIARSAEKMIKWQCSKDSSHIWSSKAYARAKRTNQSPQRCPQCYQNSKRSAGEDSLFDAVQLLLEDTALTPYQSVRDQIGGQELDIFIPEAKFGIEFNGLYYHSAKFLKDAYHEQKLAACEKAGIRLHAVWEDDWRERPERVLDAIATRLGLAEERTRNPKAITVSSADLESDTGAESVAFLNDQEPNKARLVEGIAEESSVVTVEDPAGLRAVACYTASAESEHGPLVTIGRFHVQSSFDLHLIMARIQQAHPLHKVALYADLSASDAGTYREVGFSMAGAQRPGKARKEGSSRVPYDENDPFISTDDTIYDYGRAMFMKDSL